MYPEHLDKARAKPQGPNDPVEVPDSPTPPSAADPASTSAAPTPQPVTGPSGTGAETRSPAQRALGEPSSSTASPLQLQVPITLAPITWEQVRATTPRPGTAVPTSVPVSKSTGANTETTKKKRAATDANSSAVPPLSAESQSESLESSDEDNAIQLSKISQKGPRTPSGSTPKSPPKTARKSPKNISEAVPSQEARVTRSQSARRDPADPATPATKP